MEPNEFIKDRQRKLEEIRKKGWNPYAASYPKTHTIAQSRDLEGQKVSTAGRIFLFELILLNT